MEDEYAGMVQNDYIVKPETVWIVDTGAINHMCCDKNAFQILKNAKNASPITLPDGTCKMVTQFGDIKLHDNLVLNK